MKGFTLKDLAQGLVVVLMGLLAFFARETYEQQKELAQGQTALSESVAERFHTFDVWRAEVQANRFTSMDWVRAKQALDDADNSIDKRLTRTEDTYIEIKKQLDRLEGKVDQLQNKKP